MREWDVTVEGETAREVTDDWADQLVSLIEPYGGAVGYRGTHLSVTLTLDAEDPADALRRTDALLTQGRLMLRLTRAQVEEAPAAVAGNAPLSVAS